MAFCLRNSDNDLELTTVAEILAFTELTFRSVLLKMHVQVFVKLDFSENEGDS